jgi:anti-sigma factor RsiW
MTHPEDLLAEYVDGALTDQQRAVVVAHLETCETCREEVELATGATAMLSSLPEEPVPLGLTAPVLAEARRTRESRRAFPARLQWAVGLAAAACLILLAVVLLPNLTGGGGESRDMAAGGGAKAPSAESVLGAASSVPLERSTQDYDAATVGALAKQEADAFNAGYPQVSGTPTGDQVATAADRAVACLTTAGATFDEADVLVRAIDARYQGAPAYLGVFQEGPGAGQPPDRVVVWVVARDDCSILLLTSQRI